MEGGVEKRGTDPTPILVRKTFVFSQMFTSIELNIYESITRICMHSLLKFHLSQILPGSFSVR